MNLAKRSEHVRYFKKIFRTEANMFILKNLNIEAKRTCSLVRKFISKRSEQVYIKEFKYRNEANTFDSSKNLFRSEANMFILKNLNIEAKRSKLK